MAIGQFDLRNQEYSSAPYFVLERRTQRPDQELVVEWFTNESHSSSRQRSFANVHFIVRRDEDYREPAAAALQPLLHIKTVHTGHLDVEDDAVDLI